MASSQKKTQIRTAPKNLDKFLFNNYREEGKLQEKLRDLTSYSRMRGLELDREKVHVHNEMRLSQRRHSLPLAVVSQTVAQRQDRAARPQTRASPEQARFFGRRGSSRGVDQVNEYLLTEFRRVSEVIPGILSSLNKDDSSRGEEQISARHDRTRSAAISVRSGLTTPVVRLDPDLKAFVNKHTGSKDDPNVGNIVSLISSIKSLREDVTAKKRFDVVMRSKMSFDDLLRNIHEEEQKDSESDTYTDGACVLLRRKMHKARRGSCPLLDTAMPATSQGSGVQPVRCLPRSHSTLSFPTRRQGGRELDVRAMLQDELRQATRSKVAVETRRYDHIRTRIDHFLHSVAGHDVTDRALDNCNT